MQFRFLIVPYVFVLTAACFVWWYLVPAHIGWASLTLSLGYLLAAQWLDASRHDWWRFAVTPTLLAVTGLGFCLLVSGAFSVLVLLAIIFVLELTYWQYAQSYALKSGGYVPFSLERLSFALYFLTIFFAAAIAYGLEIFLDLPLWIHAGTFALILVSVVAQWLWGSGINWREGWRNAFVIGVSVLEIFLIAGFFPLDFRLLAFLSATAYYGLTWVVSSERSGNPLRNRFWLLASLIGASWLVVFVTARWL